MNKKAKKICEQCGEVITGRGKRFCSVKCHGLWNSEHRRGENSANWRGGDVKLICEQCTKEFEVIPARADKARFCSQGCKVQWQMENTHGENHPRWQEKVKKTCEVCKKEFVVIPSRADKARFCSHECWCRWRSENERGENHPDWKEKVKLICEQCKEEFEAFPYLANKARFCSSGCKNLWMSGENSPAWKGGISFEPYGLDWTDKLKEEVRKRDNYTCAISGEAWQPGGPAFPVHHINYCKTDNGPENLITLNLSCHSKTGTNREHWQTFLVPIAEMRAFVELRGRE